MSDFDLKPQDQNSIPLDSEADSSSESEMPTLLDLAQGLRFRLEALKASGWEPGFQLSDSVEMLRPPQSNSSLEESNSPSSGPHDASLSAASSLDPASVVSPGATREWIQKATQKPESAPVSSSLDVEEADPERKKRLEQLQEVDRQVRACQECPLHQSRTNTVFGVGDPCARLMFIGEGPGYDEDQQGEPFVGKAGKLLDKMIVAMGLHRSLVYIANIVKCRPNGNRDPLPTEQQTCFPYLSQQIEIIKPELIVTLGNVPTKYLLDTQVGITRMRGQLQSYDGIPVLPTFHPAYLLRNSDGKREAWEDLKKALEILNLPLPKK